MPRPRDSLRHLARCQVPGAYGGTDMTDDWASASAADLGRAIGAGTLCPVALTEAFLDAIARHPHGTRIYARLTQRRALAAAMAARGRAKTGLRRGPLDGVPVSLKDLLDTAGTPTEAGTALLKGRIPQMDAEIVMRLERAGLIILGKTHMTELAFSGLGLNPVTATPPCVNDSDAVAGGSSSGAAAAVAFGLAPLSIGSDTGGSVRVPAAWNDLVGLKTSTGRLPLGGVVPLAPSFDTLGPLARTLEDAALALSAMEDAPTAPDLRGATLGGMRFMVLETVAQDGLAPAIAIAFESAQRRFARAGAILVHAPAPEVSEAMSLAPILYTSEVYGLWRDTIEANPERMFPPVLARFRAGQSHAAHDFVAAWARLRQLRAQFAARVAGFDAVLVPTTPNLPPKIAALEADHDLFTTENLLALRNTRIGNLMDSCALTLPTGSPSAGISLMAPHMHEGRLLRLGAAAERALG